MHNNFFQITNYTINNIFHKSKYLNLTCSFFLIIKIGRKNRKIGGCSDSSHGCVSAAVAFCEVVGRNVLKLKCSVATCSRCRLLVTFDLEVFELSVRWFLLSTPNEPLLGSFTLTSACMSL